MKISRYLDHAILKPDLNEQEVIEAIKLGLKYDVKSVCMRPCDIALAKEMTKGTNTEVSVVLGFPHGSIPAELKANEAEYYCAQGVDEIDMVVNYSYIKSAKWDLVKKDIEAVTSVAKKHNVGVKVIMETSCLTVEETFKTTEIAIEAGADFVKTSTGFNGGGATVEHVQAMLDASKGRIKVKPSGGMKTYEDAKKFVDMGVDRLGIGFFFAEAICEGEKAAEK